MGSLNSLLIGFYTLLSYSYSQRHTHLTLGSWERDTGAPSALTDRAENRKRKIFPFSFLNRFCYPWSWQARDFPIVFGSQIRTVPIRTCACDYCAEARDMPTSSSILALG